MKNFDRRSFEDMTTRHEKEGSEFINRAHERALEENRERSLTPREQLQEVLGTEEYNERYNYDKAREIVERYPELGEERDLMLKLVVSGRSYAPKLASEKLRNDKQFAIEAVKRNGRALHCFSETIRGDKEIVLVAVMQRGLSLEYASAELQDDEDVVMAAIKQDGTLSYASERLRNNKLFIIESIKHYNHHNSLDVLRGKKIPTNLLFDNEILLALGSNEKFMYGLQEKAHEGSGWSEKKQDMSKLNNLSEMIKVALQRKQEQNK